MTPATGLAVDGYVVLDLLDPDDVDELRAAFDALALDPEVPFLATCNDLDRATATAVDQTVREVVGPPLASVLPDHEVFVAGFITKGAGSGVVGQHQDLTYTDERLYRSLVVWAPLVDVDETSGALHVVPGSHRRTTGIRPGGDGPLPTDALQDALWAEAVAIPLRAGQALVYDAALVHGSTPNGAATTRPVVAVAAAPTGADLLHFHRVGDAVVGHRVDRSYYTRQSLRSVPAGYPEVEPWTAPVAPTDLAVRPVHAEPDHRSDDAEATPTQPAPAPAPVAVQPAPAAAPSRRPWLTTRRSPGLARLSHRQALLDEGLDLRLRRDGFVTVPLISPSSAAELRERYGALHGWEGAGFEPDLTNPDRAYRAEVSALLAASLDEVVGRRFAGYSPYLRVFLCKWPGEGSDLYLHRDWMYVDERSGHRSYVVWIALQDVTGDEGQIQVLRHSHRIDPMLRGTGLDGAWIHAEEDAVRSRLLTVPVRAGEAIVMDNALVHCSLPNLTTEPRVVAAIGMRPVEAPLVHFRRRDDGHVTRYDVDEAFFLTTTPQDLLADAPGLPAAEVVPSGEAPMTAADLERRLATSPLTHLDHAQRLLTRVRSR